MTKLQLKSQTSDCENKRREYQEVSDNIRRKGEKIEEVTQDWRDAAHQKLNAENESEKAVLVGVLRTLVREKEELEAELKILVNKRLGIYTDYHLGNCAELIGSIK